MAGMRTLWLVLALVGCADEVSTAQCNACNPPNFTQTDCERFAMEYDCESGRAMSFTDNQCALGLPARTYIACVFTHCATPPMCGH